MKYYRERGDQSSRVAPLVTKRNKWSQTGEKRSTLSAINREKYISRGAGSLNPGKLSAFLRRRVNRGNAALRDRENRTNCTAGKSPRYHRIYISLLTAICNFIYFIPPFGPFRVIYGSGEGGPSGYSASPRSTALRLYLTADLFPSRRTVI